MNLEKLQTKIESLQQDMLATLETLVRAESPSTDKAAADAYAEMLAARFEDLGGRISLEYD